MRIPVLSLYQPYASLLFAPDVLRKVHETRGWPMPDRLLMKTVGIHATKALAPRKWISDELRDACAVLFGHDWRDSLTRSAVLGTVVFTRSAPTWTVGPEGDVDRLAGDWSDGRWAWRTDDPQLFEQPIAMSGRQGVWAADLPLKGAALVGAQVGDDGPNLFG